MGPSSVQECVDIPEGQISEHRWQANFHSAGASAKFVVCILAYPESALQNAFTNVCFSVPSRLLLKSTEAFLLP